MTTQQGITLQFRKECQKILLQDILYLAPYSFKGSLDDPHTILRNALMASVVVMKSYLLSKLCYGHSWYHESNIIDDKCVEVSVMHHLYYNTLDIPIGFKVYEFPKTLTIVVTGDGGRIPKVPMGTPNMALAFVRVLGLKDYAHHSRHSGLPILISRLGDKHEDLPQYLSEACQDLHGQGAFKVYHPGKDLFCVYKYKRWDNADWDWSYKLCNNAVGPTGNYGLPSIVRYNNGTCKGLLTRSDKLYHCLDVGITPNTDGKTHEQLLTPNEEGQYWSGYRLTTNEVASIWGQEVDEMWNNYAASHPNRQFSAHFERQKRIQFAKDLQIGVLGESNVRNWCGIFDVCHAWWAWMNYMLALLIMLMWGVWRWSMDDVLLVISCLGVEYLTKQVKKYCLDNQSRSCTQWIKLYTNGIMLRTVINGWHGALCQAVAVAEKSKRKNQTSKDFIVTLLCTFIIISKKMRKSWATLLTDKFEWPRDNSTPPPITELINDVRLATYLAYQICSKMV